MSEKSNAGANKNHGTGMLEEMHGICQILMEKQKSQEEYQEKFNNDISAKLENSVGKVIERLDSMQNEMNGRKRKREESTCSLETPAKKSDMSDSTSQTISSDTANEVLHGIRDVRSICQRLKENPLAVDEFNNGMFEKLDALEEICSTLTDESSDETRTDNSKISDDSINSSKSTGEPISLTGKQFVLKHTFKDFSKLEDGFTVCSVHQEHFGTTWFMRIHRTGEQLDVSCFCGKRNATNAWSVEADFEFRRKLKNRNTNTEVYSSKLEMKVEKAHMFKGVTVLIEWKNLENEYLIDGEFVCEFAVNIKNMTGIYKENSRCFDETTKECSDIILVVGGKKFYVSKLYLAAHSSYFKTLFLGMFGESNKSEITLTGIDADDFQNYLEVLYGESAIDYYTVEGILLVADMFDTQIVIRKCEDFLLKESTMILKTKLNMSVRYHLDNLKNQCLSKIKTLDDIRDVVPNNIQEMNPSLMAALLEKALATSQRSFRFPIPMSTK